MNYEQEQQFAAEVKRYVTEHLPLSQISDSELQQQIEDIVEQRIGAGYCSIEQRVSIVEQVYSSIRGFGLLDSIIKDDTITEVMINGPENVFIEQNGRLFKLDKQFESQRKLEDIIQRSWALRAVRSIRPTLSATPGFPTAPVSMWYCRPLPCAAPRSPSESSPRPL
jgi:pilus assembly protein CpaF